LEGIKNLIKMTENLIYQPNNRINNTQQIKKTNLKDIASQKSSLLDNNTKNDSKKETRNIFSSIAVNNSKKTNEVETTLKEKKVNFDEKFEKIEFMSFNQEKKKEKYSIRFVDEDNKLTEIEPKFDVLISNKILKPGSKRKFDSKKRLKIFKEIEDDIFKAM
jgi:hypothetical protein